MKKLLVLCSLLLLLCCAFRGVSQEVNTQGRDFWVSFLPNFGGTVPKLEILVAGQTPCSGKATNPLTGWVATFNVTPGEVTSVVIPNEQGLMDRLKANKVEHKAIHVTTTEDVSLYASNYFDYSFDVANVLPTEILQDNYMVQSYNSGNHSINDENSRMLILATENNTRVTIDPKGGLRGMRNLTSTQTVKLNAGECYMCISATGDISGTTVRSKDGKKIAVFSGGDTQIPADGQAYDAVFEQSMPVAYWGRDFVVTATAMRDNDMVRITALSSGCHVSIDGQHKKTLAARQSYDFKIDSDKQEVAYISASSPVCVCLYLTSYTMGGPNGDPAMVNINPIEQQMDKVTFASFKTLRSEYHFVNVVTQTDQVNNMFLDGKPIAQEFKPVPSKSELSYARINVEHGSHTLESKEGGFVAHIYGLGPYESYAYTLGSNSKELNQFDDDGNLIVSNIPGDMDDEKPEPLPPVEEKPEPVKVTTETLPPVSFNGVDLSKVGSSKGVIDDKDGLIKDPELFDVGVDSDYDYLFDTIIACICSDTILLEFHPRPSLCECFLPNEVRVNVVLTSKPNLDDGHPRVIVIPIRVPVEKKGTWLTRCLWVLVALAGLFVFIGYLLAILKKNRFKKYASIKPSYFRQVGGRSVEVVQSGSPLRKPGLWAWLNRWFNPFVDERCTHNWTVPRTGPMTFVAGSSKEEVLLSKASFKVDTMSMPGYNPKLADSKQRLIPMSGKISVYSDKNRTKQMGGLSFDSGNGNDEGGFRLFIGIIIAVAVVAIAVLAILMVRALV